jgi:putative nucleotidyltransferase with HDIG domain
LVSLPYRARTAGSTVSTGRRRSRPLVSAAYHARLTAAGVTAAGVTARDSVAGAGVAAPPPTSHPLAEERWKRRPVLGQLVRVLALAVPLTASVLAAAALSRTVQRPSSLAGAVGWWVMLIVVSTLVIAVVDRAARRLLPLAALLRLCMVFPDHAPSRFSVAFKAGTTRNLREKLALAREQGVADEPARAAERILVLVAAMNMHHRATRGHSERVRAFNDLIAEELRLPEADRDRLRWAALLHDVGKLEVPTRILDKPGKPTEAEWVTLRRHPEDGARMVAPLRDWLGPWAVAIEAHHERWDGAGYPRGLAGQEIGLAARIVAVADVFEVMTAPRAYRRPVKAEAARAELARCAGSQLDPAVVRAFLNVSLGRLRVAMGPLSWLAQLPFVGALPRLEGVAAAGRSVATVAGTATGVGALALIGVVGPPPTADGPVQLDAQTAQRSTGVTTVPPGSSPSPRTTDPRALDAGTVVAPGPDAAAVGATATAPQPGTQSGPPPGPVGTVGASSGAGAPAATRGRQGVQEEDKRKNKGKRKDKARGPDKRKDKDEHKGKGKKKGGG